MSHGKVRGKSVGLRRQGKERSRGSAPVTYRPWNDRPRMLSSVRLWVDRASLSCFLLAFLLRLPTAAGAALICRLDGAGRPTWLHHAAAGRCWLSAGRPAGWSTRATRGWDSHITSAGFSQTRHLKHDLERPRQKLHGFF